jgi:hypothetical protein
MALNAYITVTAIPSIFLGTAWIFTSKDWVMGLIFLFFASLAYCIFLGIDHYCEMEEIKQLYPYGKR